MNSSLTWIDYDSAAHARSQRILAFFSERETRDELGLGGIRDSFADRLFPGTSTIQTRLRYMLFIPLMYRELEEKKVPSRDIAYRAERYEKELFDPLLAEADEHGGIFGRSAGEGLQRLPSSVYWAGLGAWGIRRYQGSQSQYHRDLDIIYERRKRLRKRREWATNLKDDLDTEWDPTIVTWHPKLPNPPESFPDKVNCKLTRGEARFLQDCIKNTHDDSLLAYLALDPKLADVPYPWRHPELGSFRDEHRQLLEQARLFSLTLHGASILYNVLLAELSGRDELTDKHRKTFQDWSDRINSEYSTIDAWAGNLGSLWTSVIGYGHTISPATRFFVERWVRLVAIHRGSLLELTAARQLVRRREEQKKGQNSRFLNRRALDQWGGYSGMERLSFRWPNARTFLRDLYEGLKG